MQFLEQFLRRTDSRVSQNAAVKGCKTVEKRQLARLDELSQRVLLTIRLLA